MAAALHDDEVAAGAAGGVLGGGHRHREVAVAVDGEHRDPLLAQRVEHGLGGPAAQDRRRRAEQPPRPADVAGDRRRDEPAELDGLATGRGTRAPW